MRKRHLQLFVHKYSLLSIQHCHFSSLLAAVLRLRDGVILVGGELPRVPPVMLLRLVLPLVMLLAVPLLLPLPTRSARSVPGPADRLPALLLLLLLMLLLLVWVVALVDDADGVHVVRGVVDRLAQLL